MSYSEWGVNVIARDNKRIYTCLSVAKESLPTVLCSTTLTFRYKYHCLVWGFAWYANIISVISYPVIEPEVEVEDIPDLTLYDLEVTEFLGFIKEYIVYPNTIYVLINECRVGIIAVWLNRSYNNVNMSSVKTESSL